MTTTPAPTCTDDLLAEIEAEYRGMARLDSVVIMWGNLMDILARLHAAEEELRITNALLEQRERVLNAIPECPMHGPDCVPHAVEWVHAAEKDAGRYRWLTRQAWFQSAFDRYDIDDGGLQSIFERECAHIIDKSIQSEASK